MENYTWFKFSPAQWFMGKIQRCSPEAQADYIRLLCLYWNKGGEMTFEEAQDECFHLEELIKYKAVKVDEGMISISFLDNQLDDIQEMSEKRSRAGKASAAKRSKRSTKSNTSSTSVQQVLTHDEQVSTYKIREDKNRIEKKREEKRRDVVFPFDGLEFMNLWEQWKLYKSKEHNFKYKSIQSEQAGLNKLSKLSNGNEQQAIQIIVQSLENGWKGLFDVKQSNNNANGDSEISADWLAGR